MKQNTTIFVHSRRVEASKTSEISGESKKDRSRHSVSLKRTKAIVEVGLRMKAKGAAVVVNPAAVVSFDHKSRDAYGFAVRPQHEEEVERSDRWKDFLERQSEWAQLPVNDSFETIKLNFESTNTTDDDCSKNDAEADDSNGQETKPKSLNEEKKEVPSATDGKVHRVQTWTEIRSSLRAIDDMMSSRVKEKASLTKRNNPDLGAGKQLPSIEEARPAKGASEEDSDEEFYDLERSESDSIQEIPPGDSMPTHSESLPPWKEELEILVQGGVPMALRGEIWQAFVGVRARRVEKYYQNLLSSDTKIEIKNNELEEKNHDTNIECMGVPEKWKGQIEKDLPRTFPGHPALDEDGRNALRRLLTAYARHNPSVGYCQAMNFFAGLLLLLMPEENAFWTLMGILDDYFDGYYSEEMIESQVDQLVLEELVREKFPKLGFKPSGLPGSAGGMGDWAVVSHNIYEYASMGKWKSCNAIPDCTCFNGVICLHGLPECSRKRLQELRNKHRPAVMAALEERSKGIRVWRDSQGLASNLYSFKQDSNSMIARTGKPEETDTVTNVNELNVSHLDASPANVDELYMSLNGEMEVDPAKDLQEQVVWLKVELCKLLEEKRSAELRAEELETALMEMVKQDNRRQLSARVEQLEREVSQLREALVDKHEQENAMLQILMRVEQEQRVTEDARIFAEQDAAAQRYAAQVLQEKYEEATTALAEMEKRAVMAESMLEATLQYQSGQHKALSSPRSIQQSNQDPSQDMPTRKISLLSRPFGLGWRDRNKQGNSSSVEDQNDGKSPKEGQSLSLEQEETNGHKVEKI
ncbi:hypothetical protein DH2020_021696 [Rehmannia glutinosa]|uniref:Rab-GAP TBC domain-containing protein n=1 Tax=Rehmannia glutinosa TaxID=99300 RepID=A0ABR0WB84_REHGL